MTEFRVLPDAESLAAAAADLVAARIVEGVRAAGRFTLVLAGGSTPRRAYELLAQRGAASLPWDRVHVFWSDERCVPPGDADSNFGAAKTSLLDRVAIPSANVHSLRAEIAPPSGAADEAERELRAFFGDAAPFPRFDLVLLGVGEDGHTASLFPGNPALEERKRWVVAVEADAKPPRRRLTLTLPVLDAAREVVFLAAGASKRPVISAIAAERAAAARRFPAAMVRAERITWLVDEAASREVPSIG
jgi:6-phosphogluconolactonase